MMRKATAYFDSEDHAHATLEQCQVAELLLLAIPQEIAVALVKQKKKVIDILNVTATSRLGARGKKRPRRFDAEQFPLPIVKSETTTP